MQKYEKNTSETVRKNLLFISSLKNAFIIYLTFCISANSSQTFRYIFLILSLTLLNTFNKVT